MALFTRCRILTKFRPILQGVPIKTPMYTQASLLGVKKPLAWSNQLISRPIYTTPPVSGWTKEMFFGHRLWTTERLLYIALLGVIPIAVAWPNKLVDCVLAFGLMSHSHWGMEAVALNYFRPSLLGPMVAKTTHYVVLAFSLTTLAGLYYFIYKDVGLGQGVRNIWAIKSKRAMEADSAGVVLSKDVI